MMTADDERSSTDVASTESTKADPPWVPRKVVRVELALFPVRLIDAGGLEVYVNGRWRAQTLFKVYDDVSLQTVVEIMVRRHRALDE